MWHSWSMIGVTNGLDTQSVKRIKLVNRLSAIFLITALSYCVALFLLGLTTAAWILFISSIVLGIAPVFNHFHKYLYARILTIAASNLILLSFELIMGSNCGSYLVYYYVGILPWVLFKEKERSLAVVASAVSLALMCYCSLSQHAPQILLNFTIIRFCYMSALTISFGLLAVTIFMFRIDNYEAEKYLFKTNKLYEETQKKLQLTLNENNAAISFVQLMYNYNNDVDEMCEAGLQKVMELLNCTYGAVLLYDKKADLLTIRAEAGFNSAGRRPAAVANGETLTGDAFQKQKTIRINNIKADYWHTSSALGSIQPAELVIVPMTFKTQAGILEVAFLRSPDEAEMALLQRLSTAFAANVLALESNMENKAQAELLTQQKNELAESNRKLEELRQIAEKRMTEQYNAQQTLLRQILEKSRQKEEELTAQINQLKTNR